MQWSKAVAVRVRVGEAICQGPQKCNDLVFLLVRQPKITDRCIDVFGDFRWRPARSFFRSGWASSTLNLINVAGIIEVHYLFQTLQVAVVHI